MPNFGWAALSVALVSALSAAGYLAMVFGGMGSGGRVFFLVSLAVGALLGDVFFHIMPELMTNPGLAPQTPYFMVAGILAFFILEKFMRWRHCHTSESGHYHPMVTMTLVGDSAHNLLDGLMIGAAWQMDFKVGLATSLAVFFHELPQELGHYGILLSGGMSPKKALAFNAASALVAFLGLGLAVVAVHCSPQVSGALGAATAGGFIYVAGSDLVPELHHELDARRSLVQLAAILLGLGSMMALKLVLG
jgi:zinc and cadmium transporter